MHLNWDEVEAAFAQSTDGTVGIEEEFALLDPQTLELTSRYEELREIARADAVLDASISGELISSEIEIRSGRGATVHEALHAQREHRARLFALAQDNDVLLGASATHPFSDYRVQHNIETEHYRRVVDGLGYPARRNNTFSLHVHVGVQGLDRVIDVGDRLRGVLPVLLAISANSPFLDARDTGLHSARSQSFTKSFPRCGIPDAYGSWRAYRDYIELLERTDSIVEYTQVWWSLRPHSFGTLELRICDSQSTAEESDALAELMVACVLQAARDHDDGVPHEPLPRRLHEENFWRAIRFGMDAQLIDFVRDARVFEARAALEGVLGWTAPVRRELGVEPSFPEANGAQRQRAQIAAGVTMEDIFAADVAATAASYAPGVSARA